MSTVEEQVSEAVGVLVTGRTAYEAMLKGMGRKVIRQLREMLRKLPPEKVFRLAKFHEREDLHPDVKKLLLAGLYYIHTQEQAKAARTPRQLHPRPPSKPKNKKRRGKK